MRLATLALTATLMSQLSVNADSIAPSTGQGLSIGVADQNFTIVSAPTGAILNPGGITDTVAPVVTPPYVKPPAGTQWVGPNVNNMVSQPIGNYDFQTSFTLSDPTATSIAGVVASDNKLVNIYLNGKSLNIGGGSLDTLINYSITNGFNMGKNTLDFIVNNDRTGGPTALLVSETTTIHSTPEPSVLALFALAGMALLGRQAMASRSARRKP